MRGIHLTVSCSPLSLRSKIKRLGSSFCLIYLSVNCSGHQYIVLKWLKISICVGLRYVISNANLWKAFNGRSTWLLGISYRWKFIIWRILWVSCRIEIQGPILLQDKFIYDKLFQTFFHGLISNRVYYVHIKVKAEIEKVYRNWLFS